MISSYCGMNLHSHHITDATWTSESSPRLWKQMHSPTFTASPKATSFRIPFILWILQTTTHTSLFWLIKVKTYSAIPDWGNLSSGLRLQFKTFSEHKNTAIFHWIPFPAIYANIYIAPWVAFFFNFVATRHRKLSQWHQCHEENEDIQSNKCAGSEFFWQGSV